MFTKQNLYIFITKRTELFGVLSCVKIYLFLLTPDQMCLVLFRCQKVLEFRTLGRVPVAVHQTIVSSRCTLDNRVRLPYTEQSCPVAVHRTIVSGCRTPDNCVRCCFTARVPTFCPLVKSILYRTSLICRQAGLYV